MRLDPAGILPNHQCQSSMNDFCHLHLASSLCRILFVFSVVSNSYYLMDLEDHGSTGDAWYRSSIALRVLGLGQCSYVRSQDCVRKIPISHEPSVPKQLRSGRYCSRLVRLAIIPVGNPWSNDYVECIGVLR